MALRPSRPETTCYISSANKAKIAPLSSLAVTPAQLRLTGLHSAADEFDGGKSGVRWIERPERIIVTPGDRAVVDLHLLLEKGIGRRTTGVKSKVSRMNPLLSSMLNIEKIPQLQTQPQPTDYFAFTFI
jgi:hypothetical protein